jgi:hypothetical protein
VTDSEVITIELVGEFLGLDQDQAMFRHFRDHHADLFPGLKRITRTTFVRQAANLWKVKQRLHQRLVCRIPLHEVPLWLIDSFPLHVCRFARAKSCKLFAGTASFGYDPLLRNTFYGVRVHLRVSDEGPIAQMQMAPANVAELAVIDDLIPPEGGVGLGDRNYWSPIKAEELRQQGLVLLAPFKSKKHDPAPEQTKVVTRARRLIETIIGQLVERFHAKRTWARDLWHLGHRLMRKVLSHTAAVLINVRLGNPPLHLAALLAN